MELQEVMDTLRSKGKPNTAKVYARHGVTGECLGVSYADLGALERKLKLDHALALALWQTGVHDARILAGKIADPARMTRAEIEGWLADTDNYVINDAVSGLAGRMPEAAALARDWIESSDEWKGAAGWTVLVQLATGGHIDEDEARGLIETIRARIHGAKNRTRYSMNSALIAIGGSMPALHEAALEAARAIGKVEVDHGETGCKTPDAASYIARMVEHAAAREESAASEKKAGTSKKRPAASKKKAAPPDGKAARTRGHDD